MGGLKCSALWGLKIIDVFFSIIFFLIIAPFFVLRNLLLSYFIIDILLTLRGHDRFEADMHMNS